MLFETKAPRPGRLLIALRSSIPAMTVMMATLSLSHPAEAAVIDFESLGDLQQVTDQFLGQGVQLSNATVLTSGISLNEFDFPPASGIHVVFDDGGPIHFDFVNPVSNFSAHLTYTVALTLAAFDGSDTLLTQVQSTSSSNLGATETLTVSIPGIRRIIVAGDPAGSSFALDDAQFSGDIPEPGTSALLAAGLFAACVFRRFRQ